MAFVIPTQITRTVRPVVRRILRTPRLVRWLGRSRSTAVDGLILDPQLAAMAHLEDVLGDVSAVAGRTPAEARAGLHSVLAAVADDPPPGVAARAATVSGAAGPLAARVYQPAGLAAPSPGIVFLHGGGWVTGDLDTHDTLCRLLAREAGVRVIAVHYRRAPEHRFPAAFEDGLAAFRDVAARAGSFGLDPARLALCGDSAGANLSAVIAAHARADAPGPALQILLYPATDGTRSMRSHALFRDGYFLTGAGIDWYFDHYVPPEVDRRHPDVSPLHREDLAGICPALMITAGFDPLRDEGAAYAERLRAAGVDVEYRCYETLVHGFALMTGPIDAARAATVEVARAAGERLRLIPA